jgi:hypothetical protein
MFNNFGGIGNVATIGFSENFEIGGNSIREVPTTTLDSLNLEKCRLIKIDAEGMDFTILKGAEETIQRCKPFVLVEVGAQELDESSGRYTNINSSVYEQVAYMKKFAYESFLICSLLYNPNNVFNNKINMFGKMGSFGLFFCPTWYKKALEPLGNFLQQLS